MLSPPCRTRNTARCPPVPTPGPPAKMDKAAVKKQKELDKAKAKAEKEAKKARVKAEKEVGTPPARRPPMPAHARPLPAHAAPVLTSVARSPFVGARKELLCSEEYKFPNRGSFGARPLLRSGSPDATSAALAVASSPRISALLCPSGVVMTVMV